MKKKLKNVLKRFLPVPAHSFYIVTNEVWNSLLNRLDEVSGSLLSAINELTNKLGNTSNTIISTIRSEHKETKSAIVEEFAKITKNSDLQQKDRYLDLAITQRETTDHIEQLIAQSQKQEEILRTLIETQQRQEEIIEKVILELGNNRELNRASSKEIAELARLIIRELRETAGVSREILWAEVFNSSTSNSNWVKKTSFSPGRWAVGYPLLYVLYSILLKAKPQSILELGLGQSTQMITQYAFEYPLVKHLVVEQNADWAEFFKKDHEVAPNTQIKLLECIEGSFKEDSKITVYHNFKQEVGNDKYDLILIDAPIYNKVSEYSRVDVLSILPSSLADSFVILMDDYNRPGESKTAEEISAVLNEHHILFAEGSYKGEKRIHIWTSKDLAYLCTL